MKRLGQVIRKWRQSSDLTLQQAAVEIGVSKATMSRLERGLMPDALTLKRVICWLLEN